MSHHATRSSSGGDSIAKRRKIRKGTHSCWECRRRKTRCQYASATASICAGCEARGTVCLSQEFPDEQPLASDKGLSQRLSRVEGLLEKLVEHTTYPSYTPSQVGGPLTSSVSAEDELDSSPNMLRPSTAEHPPVADIFDALRGDNGSSASIQTSFVPTVVSTQAELVSTLPAKFARISKTLHAMFPCQHDIDTILAVGSGAVFVVAYFNGYEAPYESPSTVSEVPPVSSHPALLAKRLMQLTLCIQRISKGKFPKNLISREPIRAQIGRYVNVVSDLVASNDDLVGSAEGLETLTLLSLYHSNVGNLRKSWLVLRRALAVIQLMGATRWSDDKPLKSIDPRSDPVTRSRGSALWHRMNFSDRYLSLLLGLPAASEDDSFATPGLLDADLPADKLSKLHCVISGAIIKRNASYHGKGTAALDASFVATQAIDRSLDAAAKSVGAEWWQPVKPPDTTTATSKELIDAHTHVMMQMNHYHLLTLLHLPYFIRDPKERRWDYSKTTCLHASRKVLEAYLVFRHLTDAAGACRHTDYGALTASMTLLLGYLDPKLRSRDPQTSYQRSADRKLVLAVRNVMQEVAERDDDKLSRETSDIITRLLPLTDVDLTASSSSSLDAPVRLEIPYLGTININPVSRRMQQDRPQLPQDGPYTPSAPANSNNKRHAKQDRPQRSTTIPENVYANNDPNTTPIDPSLQQQPLEAPLTFLNSLGEDANFSFMQFEPADPSGPYQLPELAADMDEWTFQGFDANFFENLFS
ncbi:hypothetical protein F5Y00DRAFT_19166 [Daldinia vernicosa]|uniref:uncharacterized protein n=1 Tax=Daldinia vernicosa TaxID=114800 RepID=UPI002007EDD8|nr:uncharacterized protein F5Y00DRAFT_19166 [Daldinia vernicosa]KAI0851289.1 hypothetical protein F5Y00DRAFT_19166 [Daldinia vernicosa]